MHKHLFLFGGGLPFTPRLARKFSSIVQKNNKPVSILFIVRDGWEEYISRFQSDLMKFGLTNFHAIPLPSTSHDDAVNRIQNSSGIIILGGNTNLYADYIVDTPISQAIKAAYDDGVPVAGFSAGALISPETCIISTKDNDQQEYQERKGLGLVSNVIIAVHFSQWGDEDHLRQAVSKHPNYRNYGIDEDTGIYLKNNQLMDVEGFSVYSIDNGELIGIK